MCAGCATASPRPAPHLAQLIQAQLQDHLDAGAAAASFATANFGTFRALLRLARTLLRSYYPLLGPRAGALVQALVAGAWGSPVPRCAALWSAALLRPTARGVLGGRLKALES